MTTSGAVPRTAGLRSPRASGRPRGRFRAGLSRLRAEPSARWRPKDPRPRSERREWHGAPGLKMVVVCLRGCSRLRLTEPGTGPRKYFSFLCNKPGGLAQDRRGGYGVGAAVPSAVCVQSRRQSADAGAQCATPVVWRASAAAVRVCGGASTRRCRRPLPRRAPHSPQGPCRTRLARRRHSDFDFAGRMTATCSRTRHSALRTSSKRRRSLRTAGHTHLRAEPVRWASQHGKAARRGSSCSRRKGNSPDCWA